MASVQTIIEADLFTLCVEGDLSRELTRVFCCDLLSIAMGKAPEGCAWVTVMGNKNTLAVATLADAGCVVLAEGVHFNEADEICAKEQGITVFTTEMPIFEAALKIQELLS